MWIRGHVLKWCGLFIHSCFNHAVLYLWVKPFLPFFFFSFSYLFFIQKAYFTCYYYITFGSHEEAGWGLSKHLIILFCSDLVIMLTGITQQMLCTFRSLVFLLITCSTVLEKVPQMHIICTYLTLQFTVLQVVEALFVISPIFCFILSVLLPKFLI